MAAVQQANKVVFIKEILKNGKCQIAAKTGNNDAIKIIDIIQLFIFE